MKTSYSIDHLTQAANACTNAAMVCIDVAEEITRSESAYLRIWEALKTIARRADPKTAALQAVADEIEATRDEITP